MSLSLFVQRDVGLWEQLFKVLEYTFLVVLDGEDRLLAWNPAFAHLFPETPDLEGKAFDELLTAPEGEDPLADKTLKGKASATRLLRSRPGNCYFRCVTLPSGEGSLICGERLNITEDEAFNALSRLTNEMAGINMKLAQKHRELKNAYTEIEHISQTDSLTNLPNRRFFLEHLQGTLELAVQGGEAFALVLFDLDHFKKINDQFGHDAGDRVLQYFAGLLKKHGRKGDLSARFGGEEFISLLPATTIEEACFFAERIREELSAQVLLDTEHQCTVSAGICGYAQHFSREELIKQADLALYIAKESGRNRVSVYSS